MPRVLPHPDHPQAELEPPRDPARERRLAAVTEELFALVARMSFWMQRSGATLNGDPMLRRELLRSRVLVAYVNEGGELPERGPLG